MQDHSILRALIANQGTNMKQQSFKIERDMVGVSQDSTIDMNTEIYSVISNLEVGKRSGDDQDATPSTLVASTDLDCFWNYWETVLEDEPQVEEDHEKEQLDLLLLSILKL